MSIRFEYWKKTKTITSRGVKFKVDDGRKRVIVDRDENNKLNTFRNQRGSGIKSLNQAVAIKNKTGTFYTDRVRVGKTTTEVRGFKGVTKTSNVGVIESTKPTKSTAPYQYTCYLTFQLKGKNKFAKTTGFSNFVNKTNDYGDVKGTKQQAFNRAIGMANSQGIITYEHDIQYGSDSRGVAIKGDEIIHFTISFEILTYLRLS